MEGNTGIEFYINDRSFKEENFPNQILKDL